MARTYRLIVGRTEAGRRLDRYLAARLPAEASRRMIQRCILGGEVTVNDQRVKAHRALRAGDVVLARCVWLPPQQGEHPPVAQPIPLSILYEDEQLLVINKPPGLVTHPAPGHWDGTLVNAVLWHLQEARGWRLEARGENRSHEPRATSHEPTLPRAGIVHRLDKGTSGLLLVAKTELARSQLSRQLMQRTVTRRYLALVEGKMPLERGTVRAAIGRHQRHRKQMTVRHVGGRSATTHYHVLRRYGPAPIAYSLVEARLETGRTHQVRVHLAHVGHPVLGDATYGRRSASSWAALGVTRQLLHAYELSFRHPSTGAWMTFTAPLPPDMAGWLPDGAVVEPLGQREGATS